MIKGKENVIIIGNVTAHLFLSTVKSLRLDGRWVKVREIDVWGNRALPAMWSLHSLQRVLLKATILNPNIG